MAKLKDNEILSICRQESTQAQSYVTSEISDDRENAMDRYLGLPFGDEVAGQSTVVTRSTLETVEWIMPSLLRIFVAGDDIIRYEPETPEDEQFAEQATDLANVVFNKDNNGFLILNTWFKDALLQKMGVLKTDYNEDESTTTTEYTGLSLPELTNLLYDDSVEVDEHTSVLADGSEYDPAVDLLVDEQGMSPEVFHNVKVTRTVTKGRIEILPVPPEEFYQSYDSADPDKAAYLEHRVSKTRSKLVEEGFDKKVVDSLPGGDSNDENGEEQARMGTTHTDEHADSTMKEVIVHDSYVFIDTNDDGIAEWWNIVWVGEHILEKTEVKGQPFSTICPIPLPHRAYGLSLADLMSDLERIKTTLFRQTLNNLYLSNNPEREVDINKVVDLDDFLTTRPGGIKRVEQIGASREIAYPFVAEKSYMMIDGLDNMGSKRTGVSDMSAALDADVLANETATASNNNMAQKNQRVEMIARIFAETGVKHLFRRILNLLVEHQDKPRTLKMRGEWVQMDTSGWNPEMDVSIEVGLGHGNRDQQVSHLNNILMWQKEILASGGVPGSKGPMVTPKHIYNVMEKMITTVGFKSADFAFSDPGDGQAQQQEQGPDPQQALIQAQMQIEQQKGQIAMQKAQMDNQTKQEQVKLSHHEAMQKLELEAEKLDIEREKIAADMQQTAAKIRSDEAQSAAQLDAKADLELAKIADGANARAEAKDPVTVNVGGGSREINVQRNADGSLTGSMTDGG